MFQKLLQGEPARSWLRALSPALGDLRQLVQTRGTGKLTLNFKDGRVLSHDLGEARAARKERKDVSETATG